MVDTNFLLKNLFMNKVKVYFYVLSTCMEDQIGYKMNSIEIVTPDYWSGRRKDVHFMKKS